MNHANSGLESIDAKIMKMGEEIIQKMERGTAQQVLQRGLHESLVSGSMSGNDVGDYQLDTGGHRVCHGVSALDCVREQHNVFSLDPDFNRKMVEKVRRQLSEHAKKWK
ncbi:MAG: hypothetical protein HQM05_15140 [Magnetococcales bacterium]|nr:hypothetical protein [Magnetococcales bacterium]